ncbi:MAG: hypothetical protein RR202_11145, partial [Bacteroidales bacterium]
EHNTFNVGVLGSSPSWITSRSPEFSPGFFVLSPLPNNGSSDTGAPDTDSSDTAPIHFEPIPMHFGTVPLNSFWETQGPKKHRLASVEARRWFDRSKAVLQSNQSHGTHPLLFPNPHINHPNSI